MSGYVWTPVGTQNNPYTGTFDGREHVISNLNIQGVSHAGFIGYLGRSGWVKNLGLKEATVFGRYYRYTGAIAGYNYGSIYFCYAIDSKVTGSGTHVGGIAGINHFASIVGCYYTGTVTGTEHVGGLVGYNNYGYVTSSYSKADVSGIKNTGGFLGYEASSDDIADCYWDGTVNDESSGVGIGNSTSTSTGVSKVTDWEAAATAMNKLISEYDRQFVVNTGEYAGYTKEELPAYLLSPVSSTES